jgi:hypothetical protein
MWEVFLKGAWQKYDAHVGKAMVEARERGAVEYHFEVNGTKMVVDFEQMLQTNVKSGKRRPVRFGVPQISVHEHYDVEPSSVFVEVEEKKPKLQHLTVPGDHLPRSATSSIPTPNGIPCPYFVKEGAGWEEPTKSNRIGKAGTAAFASKWEMEQRAKEWSDKVKRHIPSFSYDMFPPQLHEFSTMPEGVEAPEKYSWGDIYGIGLILLLLPPMLPVWLALYVLLALPLVCINFYGGACLHRPVDSVRRTCAFYFLCTVVWIISLPAQLIAVFWALFAWAVIVVLSAPVGLLNPRRTAGSFRALWPYLGRPGANSHSLNQRSRDRPLPDPAEETATRFGYVWPFSDLVAGSIGAMDRQGLLEYLGAVSAMMAMVPIFKHILSNPFLYALEELYINQWTPALDATGDGLHKREDQQLVQSHIQHQVCRTKLHEKQRAVTDAWPFAGHHQYPPEGRASKTVAGIQFCEDVFPFISLTLFSHTTHGYQVEGHLPRSEYASFGLISVRLQWWNPWYHLTGYVEVNAREDGGVEHPMWLVNDRTSKLQMDGYVNLNKLFVTVGYYFAQYLREQPTWQKMQELVRDPEKPGWNMQMIGKVYGHDIKKQLGASIDVRSEISTDYSTRASSPV